MVLLYHESNLLSLFQTKKNRWHENTLNTGRPALRVPVNLL